MTLESLLRLKKCGNSAPPVRAKMQSGSEKSRTGTDAILSAAKHHRAPKCLPPTEEYAR